jgi:hypothetical protein
MPGVGVNATGIRAGDTQIEFGGKGNGSTTDIQLVPMPPQVYRVLNNYQRKAQISGY